MNHIVFPVVSSPRVSVLMVTYGGWDFALKALEELRAHTPSCCEVIVVDNASSDGTAQRLREAVTNARLVFNAVNRGFGPACNQAAAHATAPVLLLLNSDCFVGPGWLDPLLKTLDENPLVAAVAPLVLNVDGSLQESGCLLFGNGHTQLHGLGDDAGRDVYRFRRSVDYASGACLALRRRAFLDAGGFDAAYVPAYFEDVDLCLRLRLGGLETVVEPRSIVTHLRGASSGGSRALESWSKNLVLFRERWADLLKCRPGAGRTEMTPLETLAARDAPADATLLVISGRGPGRADGSESNRATGLLDKLGDDWRDCRLTWLTCLPPPDRAIRETLLRRGVEVAADVFDPVAWLAERRLHFDAVLPLSAPLPDPIEDALRLSQPFASRIDRAADLDAEALATALGRAGIAPSRRTPVALAPRPTAPAAISGVVRRKPNRSEGLLVLGMHRSGTSALTGCLDLLGVPLGGPLLAPNFANEKGYFEHGEIVSAHDELLEGLGTSALSLVRLPAGWTATPPAGLARERLGAVLRRSFAGKPLWAVKDPRLCLLLPLWHRVLEDLAVEPRFVLLLRDPWEIAQSLEARDGIPPAESLELWLRHATEAESLTRESVRVHVKYDRLLADPFRTVSRLGGALGVQWPFPPSSVGREITRFLEPSLKHWNGLGSDSAAASALEEPFRELYASFCALEERDDVTTRRRIDELIGTLLPILDEARGGPPPQGGGEDDYAIRWETVDVPATLSPGQRASGRVTFTHRGQAPLSIRALRISYHWLDGADPSRAIVWEGARTPVRRVLSPGETHSIAFTLLAPMRPGRHLLQVDLVREGVAWIGTKGVAPPTQQVTIE